MTEAIFGLIGVIVGAVAQGGWAWWMERRRENWAARRAGRLLARDLSRARWVLGAAARMEGAGWRGVGLELEAVARNLPERADVLAGTIKRQDAWNEISSAMDLIERTHLRATEGSPTELTDSDRKSCLDQADLLSGAAITAGEIGMVGIPGRARRLARRIWLFLRRTDEATEVGKLLSYGYIQDEYMGEIQDELSVRFGEGERPDDEPPAPATAG